MLEKFHSFLSGLLIPVEQKKYAMSFFKKINYLNELHEIAIQDMHEHVNVGYGNVNSQICFVFKNQKTHDVIKPLLSEILDKFDINLWDTYVTFVDKTESEYDKKYSFLVNEIHAVGSNLLYVFDKDDTMYNEIINTFNARCITLPEKHFMVDVQKLASSDTEVRKELWKIFRYFINYKEIKQEG